MAPHIYNPCLYVIVPLIQGKGWRLCCHRTSSPGTSLTWSEIPLITSSSVIISLPLFFASCVYFPNFSVREKLCLHCSIFQSQFFEKHLSCLCILLTFAIGRQAGIKKEKKGREGEGKQKQQGGRKKNRGKEGLKNFIIISYHLPFCVNGHPLHLNYTLTVFLVIWNGRAVISFSLKLWSRLSSSLLNLR